jgi:biotin transport system substrate-specific component
MTARSEQAQARRRLAVELAAVTSFAAVTAIGARLQLRLSFTPVPVTGQVFCVLLAGAVLGARLGFLSQAGYLAAGAAGLPIFAYGGGPAALLGPTAGYLLAFPLAAAAVGAIAGAPAGGRGARALLGCLAGVIVIYSFGAMWYGVWCAVVGATAGLWGVLAQSVFPFVGVDLVKAVLAAAVAPALRRRVPFAG